MGVIVFVFVLYNVNICFLHASVGVITFVFVLYIIPLCSLHASVDAIAFVLSLYSVQYAPPTPNDVGLIAEAYFTVVDIHSICI